MADIFNAFELKDGELRAKLPIPEAIAAQARRKTSLLLVETPSIGHRELSDLAETCIRLIADVRRGATRLPVGSHWEDNDAHLLSGLADDAQIAGALNDLHDGQTYRAWHLMCVHAVLKLDEAAICASNGDMLGTIEALCQAMESSDNATLWWTGDTIEAEASGSGQDHARSTKRLQAIDPLKEYVTDRWAAGRDDGRPWKSKRSCAIAITADVLMRAKKHGWEMTGKEPERTIYKWLRELPD
jgi:hypothetical protein